MSIVHIVYNTLIQYTVYVICIILVETLSRKNQVPVLIIGNGYLQVFHWKLYTLYMPKNVQSYLKGITLAYWTFPLSVAHCRENNIMKGV